MKSRRTFMLFLTLIMIMTMHSFTFAGTVTKAPGPGPVPVCSDLVASLKLTKTLNGGIGVITLEATICNKGNADYIGQDPLDAYFFVITWHPPKTAAQEHDFQTISHNAIGNRLNKGECKTVTIRYTIPGTVTRWADGPARVKPKADERLAFKEFTIRIEKKYPTQPGDKGFTPLEDCNIQNTRAFKTISYMEKSNIQ